VFWLAVGPSADFAAFRDELDIAALDSGILALHFAAIPPLLNLCMSCGIEFFAIPRDCPRCLGIELLHLWMELSRQASGI
jgi:hypothetical protein